MNLAEQVATHGADDYVERYGQRLPKHKQIQLWKQVYDTCLACIVAHDNIQRAQRIRTIDLISEN